MTQTHLWTQTRHLSRYIAYCILGPGLPMLLAVFTMPKVVSLLGVERFGLLSLVWVVLGYFSLFDLGFGRAAVRLFSQFLGENRTGDLLSVVMTTLAVTFFLGLIGSFSLTLLAPLLIHSVFKITPALQDEALITFYWMALTVPFIPMTSALRGILEAQQQFRLTNIIHSFLGSLTYLGPLVVLLFWENSLVAVVILLVIARLLTFALLAWVCWLHLPAHQGAIWRREWVKRLFRMGGWLTVSNALGPLMSYLDRFLIGAVISLTAVAFYATPYEVVSRLNVISSAIGQVLFPAMATFYMQQPHQAARLYRLGTIAIAASLFPIVMIVVLFAKEGLHLWMGPEFSEHSHLVMRILIVGVYFGAIAGIPLTFAQSAERSDLNAKAHLVEIVFYLPAVWWSAVNHGLVGVALVWSTRMAVDLIFLSLLSGHLVHELNGFFLRLVSILAVATALMALCVFSQPPFWVRVVCLVVAIIWFYRRLWVGLLDETQRQTARHVLATRSLRT